MNRFFVAGSFVIVMLAFTGISFVPTKKPANTIFSTQLKSLSIGQTSVRVAIADNQQTRRIGLSHLTSLPEDSGLFFVFKDSDTHGIWMKDMEFPIDIIWMNEQLQIVDIHRSVSPDSYPTSFHPTVPAKFALEVEAGFSLKYSIKIGEKCSWMSS